MTRALGFAGRLAIVGFVIGMAIMAIGRSDQSGWARGNCRSSVPGRGRAARHPPAADIDRLDPPWAGLVLRARLNAGEGVGPAVR